MLQLIPGGFLKSVQEDRTPVLGGDLDGGGYDISNIGKGTFGDLVVDTDTLVVNSVNKRVGIGTIVPSSRLHIVDEVTATTRGLIVQQSTTDTASAFINFLKSRGTASSPTSVVKEDWIGLFFAKPSDDSGFYNHASASFGFKVTGDVSTGVVPTSIILSTGSNDSSTGGTERMRITHAGEVDIIGPTFPLLRLNNPTSGGESGFRFKSFEGGNSLHSDIFIDATGSETGRLGIRVPYTNERLTILQTGNVGIGLAVPTGQLHVEQTLAEGAKTVLRLDQGDEDETFIDFMGTSAADGSKSISSDTTEDSAKFGAFRVEINGDTKWIRIYDTHS